MAVIIRTSLNRIILLFITAGMIQGLINSAVLNDSYDAARGFGEYQNEMSIPALPAGEDLIADTSAAADITRFLTEKGRSGRNILAGPDDTGWIDYRACSILSVILYVFLLCVFLSTSFKHIFYIHLKDGNK